MQAKKFGLVLTLGMIAVLVGCGGNSTSTPPPPPTPTVTAITVTPATSVISTTGSATFKAEATLQRRHSSRRFVDRDLVGLAHGDRKSERKHRHRGGQGRGNDYRNLRIKKRVGGIERNQPDLGEWNLERNLCFRAAGNRYRGSGICSWHDYCRWKREHHGRLTRFEFRG